MQAEPGGSMAGTTPLHEPSKKPARAHLTDEQLSVGR